MNIDQVERLAGVVKTYGLVSLEWDGLKITRDPGADAMRAMQDAASKMTNSATDEEILFNPNAGLGGLNG
jgi:hypothetical protein